MTLWGGMDAGNRRITVSGRVAGGTGEKDGNFALIQKNSPCIFSDLYFLQYYLLHVFNYKIKIKLHKMKE